MPKVRWSRFNSIPARSAMEVKSESMGEFAEVWMVRLDRSVSPNGTKYILVEYTHVNRHEPFVTDSELDKTTWKFTLRPVLEDGRGTCVAWASAMYPRHSADIRTYQVQRRSHVFK